MAIKLGRGFDLKDGMVRRFSTGSVSQKIRQRKSKKPRAVSKAKAMAVAQRP